MAVKQKLGDGGVVGQNRGVGKGGAAGSRLKDDERADFPGTKRRSLSVCLVVENLPLLQPLIFIYCAINIPVMASSQTEVPPPLQDIPTAKEKKYDRQLRLWGATGQVALEETHVLLVNNGPGVTGVETLKNLILPGIGKFTIVDSGVVTEADLGVNFFLDDSALGKFRADVTVELLRELNPDVEGVAVKEVGSILLCV